MFFFFNNGVDASDFFFEGTFFLLTNVFFFDGVFLRGDECFFLTKVFLILTRVSFL